MCQILQDLQDIIKNLKLERKKEHVNSVKKQGHKSSSIKKKVSKAK